MSRPTRILELRSVAGTGGGPDKTILLGAAQADRSNFAVTVAYVRDARDHVFAIDAAARRAGVQYVEVTERHSFDWTVLPALRRLVRARQTQIVHAHDYKTNLLALLLACTEGVIPLTTAHGWSGHTWREQWLYYPVDKQVMRAFPRVIVVSQEIADTLEAAGVRAERIVVIPNGIDHAAYRRIPSKQAGVRAAFGLGDQDFVIGAVGRLGPEKRFDLLIDVVARIASRRPNVRLVIAGDGPLRPALEARASRVFKPGGCRLLGHCADVATLHHTLDLFVMSSDHEGSPNVVLEAMALETPIVSTAVGGAVHMIRENVDGLLVPAGQQAALECAIEMAIDDAEARMTRARAARRRVEREFSFAGRQTALERVYADLVANRQSRDRSTAAMVETCERR
jgi:glycosyltransferase involved in cell wall biosynthesis